MNFRIRRLDSIDSTNAEALRQARQGAGEGSCIVARQQTAGRGRQGRAWISPPDAGLYLSIILRPRLDANDLPLISLLTGIAVHDTIAEAGLSPDIKWPNDILVNEKKISGILAETTETEGGVAVVVGIGINLNSRSFPSEIAASATSVQQELVEGPDPSAEFIEGLLLGQIATWYDGSVTAENASHIVEEWGRRSTYFRGKKVRVTTGNDVITGITDGLERNGALRVKTPSGEVAAIQAGDVEHLRTTE